VADASIDGNANVGHKDIVTMLNEMPKAHQKLLALNKLYYEMNKKYGFKTANDWLELEWSKGLGLHDAHTSTMIPYCFAYDLKDLAEKGLYFIENFNAQPPQHLTTFVDFVKEHCSYACNHSAGAVAYPNLIPYMYYFWKKDLDNGYLGITKDYAEKFARQQIQRLVYALNQPFLRGSIQSAFTNVNFFDHPYFEAIFGGSEFPNGEFMIDYEEEIIEFQKLFLKEMGEIRNQNMMTFPVSTISLLTTPDGKFVDEEFARWACEHNRKWNDSNWFVDSSVTSLSSCCRLRNDFSELGYYNSIGGAALKVGSVKVSTINLARIAYETETEQQYLNRLKEVLEINLKLLDVQRHIIQRNIEKGLLHTFDCKMIEMKYLYSSIGIMGIYETLKKFGYTKVDDFGNTYYTDEAFNFGKRIFKVIHNVKDMFLLDKDYHINLEAIPGESMAVRFQKADEFLYPDLVVKDLPLYGNQWIPLGIKTTLQERIRIAAAFSEYCSGGDILHLNVDAPFDNFDKAWKMLNYVAQAGVKYFAFTGKINACKNNHGFYGDVCPICGEPVSTTYSRIVGFFVPVKTYSKERKAEWAMREWENVNNES
jgi:Oxygen-sensitive ribonucleoside-triphosphate reductase